MIDTDKYEGHAKGPWNINSWEQGQSFTGINFNMTHTEQRHLAMKNGREKEREATANLIADAPLLLAEVKRLSALADALFNLIPSHLSTEATDVWNEHMGDEEE